MNDRNRSEGWQHAKLSGHKNEDLVTQYMKEDPTVQDYILEMMGYNDREIVKIFDGGLNETSTPSVLGGKTKNKTDLHIQLTHGDYINISIKKSLSGQVFLISPSRFIEGFEKLFGKTIPENVKRAISLFFGDALDATDIAQEYSKDGKILEYELHYKRLTKSTMDCYDPTLAPALLTWLDENMKDIITYCFSSGLVIGKAEWANAIWYINLVGEENPDTFIPLKDLMKENYPKCFYGDRGGGTTIQLPFGFVQYHDPGHKGNPNLQFHHNFEKVLELL